MSTVRKEVRGRQVRQLRIAVVAGPDAGARFAPVERCAVGTGEDNEVVLRDPMVSRYHLELSAGERGIEVRDLGSSNGTFFGSVRLRDAVIPAGARLSLGETTLVIEDAGTAVATEERIVEIPAIVGTSSGMQRVVQQIVKLAPSQASTLIQGETGTGKELVARAIHDLGPRAASPFVVVDCGSLPATLVASELFGHERGAFTGAEQRHSGAFEQADGGTLFLDEIGELPLAVQPSLLGVLERRRFRRVGGQRDITVDVRVVAATNRDLRAEANRGTFRPDLYFRLAVARIVLPPLRERAEDIEALVAHFVEQTTGGRELSAYFGPATLDALRAHPWAGNVRELRNVVEAALAFGQISLDDSGRDLAETAQLPYKEARAAVLATFEREYIKRLLTACEGNASEAARRARMDRPYLLSLLRRHGLR